MRRNAQSIAATKHGESSHGFRGRTAEYIAWTNMIGRCENPRATAYRNWGGRGIRVCRRWRRSFEAFLADVGRRPGAEYSIDRYPDANGDYRPGNVRWATRAEQGRNRRNNRVVAVRSISRCLAEWAERSGLEQHVIAKRLKAGWSAADALSPTVQPERFMFRGKALTAAEICRRSGVSRSAFWRRVREFESADLAVESWMKNNRGKNQRRHRHLSESEAAQ